MNRFEQRLKQRMQHPEFAAGFHEMGVEITLLEALDQIRQQLHISKEELAKRMGRKREAVSRVLNTATANPTLETITDLLLALGVTAEITLRKSVEDEEPIKIATKMETSAT